MSFLGSSTTTCCTVNQLKSLKENLKLPIQLLSRCPSCYANFRAIFCQMACNSNQSMYLNPLKIDTTTIGILVLNVIFEFVFYI